MCRKSVKATAKEVGLIVACVPLVALAAMVMWGLKFRYGDYM